MLSPCAPPEQRRLLPRSPVFHASRWLLSPHDYASFLAPLSLIIAMVSSCFGLLVQLLKLLTQVLYISADCLLVLRAVHGLPSWCLSTLVR